jgi:hypothetical protein
MEHGKPTPPSGKIVCECGTLKESGSTECPYCSRLSKMFFIVAVLGLTALSFSVLLAYGKP